MPVLHNSPVNCSFTKKHVFVFLIRGATLLTAPCHTLGYVLWFRSTLSYDVCFTRCDSLRRIATLDESIILVSSRYSVLWCSKPCAQCLSPFYIIIILFCLIRLQTLSETRDCHFHTFRWPSMNMCCDLDVWWFMEWACVHSDACGGIDGYLHKSITVFSKHCALVFGCCHAFRCELLRTWAVGHNGWSSQCFSGVAAFMPMPVEK